MSSLTSEWQSQKTENSIKYDVVIKNFIKKIKSFRMGRKIHSRIFKIGQSSFRISIYPGGNSEGHVGVFLENHSDWRVKCSATFSVEQHHRNLDDQYYGTAASVESDSWGLGSFVEHSSCTKGNLLDSNGDFVLSVEIKVLEEEVTADRDLTGDRDVARLQLDVEEHKDELKEIKEELADSKRASAQQFKELKRMMAQMTVGTQVPSASSPPSVDCIGCTEEVRLPMRLKQCGNGHIICDTCYTRDQAVGRREGREGGQCVTCRGPITGRPSALETLLGLNTGST